MDILKQLGIELPTPPKPAGSYIPVVVSGNLVFVSGQIPMEDGKLKYQGKVESDQSIENAQNAARMCIVNGLAQIKTYFGTLDNVHKIVRISGFVNSNENFIDYKTANLTTFLKEINELRKN